MMWKRIVFVIAIIGSFVAGGFFGNWRPSLTHATTSDAVLYYRCPMHPSYRSDRPGDAACCGMRLEPVRAGDAPVHSGIHVKPETQQMLGIRVAEVGTRGGVHSLRTVGRVAADERRVFRINTSVGGWIRETFDNTVGSIVKKDEPLATFYTREFLTAQQSYFYALNALDRFQAQESGEQQLTATRAQVQATIDALQSIGMSDTQIAELGKHRKLTQQIELRSPVTGFVLERRVSPGLRFNSGDELYVIADLSHVWVTADVFEYEAKRIRAGQTARLRLPHEEREFTARVSEVLPQFDSASRTLKVRLELDNPGYALRPGMFVDVEFGLSMADAVVVPAEAVVQTGTQSYVFVEDSQGSFDRREVVTGSRLGRDVVIARGLSAGDRVVVSGNFLLDSEARMRAAQKPPAKQPPKGAPKAGTVKDPVCGMDVDPSKAKYKAVKDGKTYYYCSQHCQRSHGGSK